MSSATAEACFIPSIGVPVVTGADVQECGKLFGIEFANRLLAYGESWTSYCNRQASLQSAYVRNVSASGSSASRSSVKEAGLTGSRLASIRKVKSWRSASPGSFPAATARAVPDGLCYSKLFNVSNVEASTLNCGEWPTFGAIVRMPASAFQSVSSLERFRLVGDVSSRHVAAGGIEGTSFVDAVASYATKVRVRPGTLAELVLKSGRRVAGPVPDVTGSTRLGGLTAHQRSLLQDAASSLFGFKSGGWRFLERSAVGYADLVVVAPAARSGIDNLEIGVCHDGAQWFYGFTLDDVGEGAYTMWWPQGLQSNPRPDFVAAFSGSAKFRCGDSSVAVLQRSVSAVDVQVQSSSVVASEAPLGSVTGMTIREVCGLSLCQDALEKWVVCAGKRGISSAVNFGGGALEQFLKGSSCGGLRDFLISVYAGEFGSLGLYEALAAAGKRVARDFSCSAGLDLAKITSFDVFCGYRARDSSSFGCEAIEDVHVLAGFILCAFGPFAVVSFVRYVSSGDFLVSI